MRVKPSRSLTFGMAQYLVVRDSDGAILGELDSAESALRTLDLLGDLPLRDFSLVRIEDSPGAITDTTSVTRVRSAELPIPDRRRS